MVNRVLIENLNNELQSGLSKDISEHDLQLKLTEYFDHIIKNDFQKLVFILYKIDVDEDRLKILLRENSQVDAAKIITHLIIERERQKIISRSVFNSKTGIPEDERW